MREIFASLLILAALTFPAAVRAEAAKTVGGQAAHRDKVVFQVSDADPKKWNLTLNNVKNVQDALGRDGTGRISKSSSTAPASACSGWSPRSATAFPMPSRGA